MGRCQLCRYLFQVILASIPIDTVGSYTPRSGLYPIPSRQGGLPLATEASGIILELPSDPSVLENSDFKSRGFKKGSHVAIVSLFGDLALRYLC
jgi:hypothetical protein